MNKKDKIPTIVIKDLKLDMNKITNMVSNRIDEVKKEIKKKNS